MPAQEDTRPKPFPLLSFGGSSGQDLVSQGRGDHREGPGRCGPQMTSIFTTAGSLGLQWSTPSTPQTETRLVSPSRLSSARGQPLPLLRKLPV